MTGEKQMSPNRSFSIDRFIVLNFICIITYFVAVIYLVGVLIWFDQLSNPSKRSQTHQIQLYLIENTTQRLIDNTNSHIGLWGPNRIINMRIKQYKIQSLFLMWPCCVYYNDRTENRCSIHANSNCFNFRFVDNNLIIVKLKFRSNAAKC